MNETEFEAWLQCGVEEMSQTPLDMEEAVVDIRSFGESGILTDSAGLVIKMLDGSEFQITIVRSN